MLINSYPLSTARAFIVELIFTPLRITFAKPFSVATLNLPFNSPETIYVPSSTILTTPFL